MAGWAANYQITIHNCKYNNLGMLLVRSEIARLQMREGQETRRVWSSLVTLCHDCHQATTGQQEMFTLQILSTIVTRGHLFADITLYA